MLIMSLYLISRIASLEKRSPKPHSFSPNFLPKSVFFYRFEGLNTRHLKKGCLNIEAWPLTNVVQTCVIFYISIAKNRKNGKAD